MLYSEAVRTTHHSWLIQLRQLSAIRHFIYFICSFISAITIHLLNDIIYGAIGHFLWMLCHHQTLLKTSIQGEFIESIFTSQPIPSLLGPILFIPFWTMIKTTWSWAPALQPQPRPIKRPHCGIGVEATGLRLWSQVRRGRGGQTKKMRACGHGFRTGACCKGELEGWQSGKFTIFKRKICKKYMDEALVTISNLKKNVI